MTNQRKMEVRHENSCIQAKCAAKKEISKEKEGTKFGEKLDIYVGKRLVLKWINR